MLNFEIELMMIIVMIIIVVTIYLVLCGGEGAGTLFI